MNDDQTTPLLTGPGESAASASPPAGPHDDDVPPAGSSAQTEPTDAVPPPPGTDEGPPPAFTPPWPPPPAEPPAPHGRPRGRRAAAVLGVAALVAGSATGGALLALGLEDDQPAPAPTSLSTAPAGSSDSSSTPDEPLSQAAAAVLPSVVSIAFDSNAGAGQGSGVVISADGQILTNNHVVAEAADGGTLSVTFSDGRRADAEIVGRDPATDLAVIQAQGVDDLTPARLGSSDDLHVGDTVLAIGSPLGLDGSVTSGIVSALNRSITLSNAPESPFGGRSEPTPSAVIDAIQTDAAINPGNSGGALINTDGEVVGINTAIASLAGGGGVGSQTGNIGVGFAIPIDSARSVAQQLVEDGQATHAYLGVRIADSEAGAGAVIAGVEEGQPAAEAGLQEGDVVTRVDDRQVTDASGLTSAIRSHRPGDSVSITYTRDGQEHTTDVTLGELPTD